MKAMFRLVPLLALTFPVSATGAQAQEGQTLQGFSASNFYKGLVNQALSRLPSQVLKRCPGLASGMSSFTIIRPVTFGADRFPNGGLWEHRLPMHGCGEDVTLNLFFQASADGKIETVIADPGSSIASPLLQADALKIALIALATKPEACQTVVVKSTKFEGYGLLYPPTVDPGEGHRRPWWETWTLVGCGRVLEVPMDFMPDATGTQVTQPSHIVEH